MNLTTKPLFSANGRARIRLSRHASLPELATPHPSPFPFRRGEGEDSHRWQAIAQGSNSCPSLDVFPDEV